jgi:hypothetical protein
MCIERFVQLFRWVYREVFLFFSLRGSGPQEGEMCNNVLSNYFGAWEGKFFFSSA